MNFEKPVYKQHSNKCKHLKRFKKVSRKNATFYKHYQKVAFSTHKCWTIQLINQQSYQRPSSLYFTLLLPIPGLSSPFFILYCITQDLDHRLHLLFNWWKQNEITFGVGEVLPNYDCLIEWWRHVGTSWDWAERTSMGMI